MQRLQVPFVCLSPDIDESIHAQERPHDLVMRLARAKADKVVQQLEQQTPDAQHLVIAADQVACMGSTIFNKPLTNSKASAQLAVMSGQQVDFLCGLCVLNQTTATRHEVLSAYQVHFRALDTAMIDAYLDKEQPLHCAGSFKSEGLGVALVQRFCGDDPASLIGLPLIHLVRILTLEGISVL